MDSNLRKYFFYYAMSGLCAALAVSGIILSQKYINVLSTALNQYEILHVNKLAMMRADQDIKTAITYIKSIMPYYENQETMEDMIAIALDKIVSRLKGADVSAANFESKENEINLLVTIKGKISDYKTFINDIGYLQSQRSPFFFINQLELSFKSADEKLGAGVFYEIRGTLKMRRFKVGSAA
jgi:hypothetical protein